MKQTLSLKLGQQLTMTPQLQQAIRLLQLSSLDLQQEIQTALESNPMLELEEEAESLAEEGLQQDEPPEHEDSERSSSADADERDEYNGDELEALSPDADLELEAEAADAAAVDHDEGWDTPIPDDLPVDTQWDDIYQGSSTSSGAQGPEDDWDFDSRNSAAESLQDHLMWQLNLTPMSEWTGPSPRASSTPSTPMACLTASVEEIIESLGPFDDEDDRRWNWTKWKRS